MEQDLNNLKDDMIAFIEGHGMKRFHGIINEDVSSVLWVSPEEDQADSWKDFVELAKASGAGFLTMRHVTLEDEDVNFLVDRLEDCSRTSSAK
jgi:hypothetical protein